MIKGGGTRSIRSSASSARFLATATLYVPYLGNFGIILFLMSLGSGKTMNGWWWGGVGRLSRDAALASI